MMTPDEFEKSGLKAGEATEMLQKWDADKNDGIDYKEFGGMIIANLNDGSSGAIKDAGGTHDDAADDESATIKITILKEIVAKIGKELVKLFDTFPADLKEKECGKGSVSDDISAEQFVTIAVSQGYCGITREDRERISKFVADALGSVCSKMSTSSCQFDILWKDGPLRRLLSTLNDGTVTINLKIDKNADLNDIASKLSKSIKQASSKPSDDDDDSFFTSMTGIILVGAIAILGVLVILLIAVFVVCPYCNKKKEEAKFSKLGKSIDDSYSDSYSRSSYSRSKTRSGSRSGSQSRSQSRSNSGSRTDSDWRSVTAHSPSRSTSPEDWKRNWKRNIVLNLIQLKKNKKK